MATLPVDIEVNSILNLIRGFGWELKSKEITEEQIRLKIKKKIPAK